MSKVEIIKQPAEKVSKNLKQNAWMSVVESLVTIILGILLVAFSDAVVGVIAFIVGIFLLIKGAYQIINYFVVKGQNDFFNNSLLFGIISMLVGVAMLVMGEGIISIFRIAVGVWIIYESLVHINTAIKLHAANLSIWKYILILALGMLVIGVFITFFEGAVITLIGWMLILGGVIGIVGDVMFIQYVNILIEKLTGEKHERA